MSLHTIAHEVSKIKKKWWTVLRDVVWVGPEFPCPNFHGYELNPSDHHGCMQLRWPEYHGIIHYCECTTCSSDGTAIRHYFQDADDDYQCEECLNGECPSIYEAGLAQFIGISA